MAPNPVAAMCDKIEQHVADREAALIRRLRDAVRAVEDADTVLAANAAWKELDAATAEADAYLAEPVRIEVDAAYGSVK